MTGSKGKRLDGGGVTVCKKTLKTKSFTRRRFTNLSQNTIPKGKSVSWNAHLRHVGTKDVPL